VEDPARNGRTGARADWEESRTSAASCQNCDLWARATQTVFGEGPVPAAVMLVGEQPGDEEDRKGAPFVGPAGRVLDQALVAAGIERTQTYVTNTVKHFRWEPRGKRRIHKKPTTQQIRACRPWLDTELRVVSPSLLVLMGATAAQAVFGSSFRLSQDRGHPLPSDLAPIVIATVHPSSILRAPDSISRDQAMASFVADLTAGAAALRAA